MHNFTNNDLLLYVLRDATAATSLAVSKAIQHDTVMATEAQALKEMIDEITQFEWQPDEKLMNFIMEDLFVEESKTAIV